MKKQTPLIKDFLFKIGMFSLWSIVMFFTTMIVAKSIFGSSGIFSYFGGYMPILISEFFIIFFVVYIASFSNLFSKILVIILGLSVFLVHFCVILYSAGSWNPGKYYFLEVFSLFAFSGALPILWRTIFVKNEKYQLNKNYWLVGLVMITMVILLFWIQSAIAFSDNELHTACWYRSDGEEIGGMPERVYCLLKFL
ncbi:MAG TPA: hypothetical protein VL401_02280 [Alphaproteobacteria bacterium]|nr:hypothetical protein [Alphaproteobacteria bacterium]